MKCFVVLFAIVAAAAAEAESEPWLGYGYGGLGLGYGAGLGYGGAALGYGGLGLGYAAGYGYAAPAAAAVVAAPAPVAVAAPASGLVSTASVRAAPGAPTTSQFRKGDEYGNEAFGYNNPNSARAESGNPAAGVVTGSYTNKATGTTINYVADALGFRVVPGRKRRSVPAVRYEIKYNPGYAHGYFVIPALGY